MVVQILAGIVKIKLGIYFIFISFCSFAQTQIELNDSLENVIFSLYPNVNFNYHSFHHTNLKIQLEGWTYSYYDTSLKDIAYCKIGIWKKYNFKGQLIENNEYAPIDTSISKRTVFRNSGIIRKEIYYREENNKVKFVKSFNKKGFLHTYIYIKYFNSGIAKYKYSHRNHKLHGEFWHNYKNGNTMCRGYYYNNKFDGELLCFYPNGKPKFTGLFLKGKRIGEFKYYDEKGKLKKTKTYVR